MTYEEKTSSLWWTRNPATIVYFLRELTGVFIALYAMIFLTIAVFIPHFDFAQSLFFSIVSWIGFGAAVFHSLTWFWVTVKISPFPLPLPVRIIGFLGLIAATCAASYFLMIYLYA